jgi:hypothetical protein
MASLSGWLFAVAAMALGTFVRTTALFIVSVDSFQQSPLYEADFREAPPLHARPLPARLQNRNHAELLY